MFEIGKDIFKHGFFGASGDRMGHRRMRIIYYVFVAVFIIFVVRTLQLGIEGTDRSRRAGSDGAWLVQRADIVDRNGDILAKNIMSGHVTLRPPYVKDRDRVAQTIHEILPYEYTLAQALNLVNSSRKFIYVKKYASESQRSVVEKAKLSGLEIESEQKRIRPSAIVYDVLIPQNVGSKSYVSFAFSPSYSFNC